LRSIITIEGIDQALSNLQYNNKISLKYRLVNTIRGYYNRNHSPDSVVKIETNDLVKALWDTGEDPELIRNQP
jgi:hypothetical protein